MKRLHFLYISMIFTTHLYAACPAPAVCMPPSKVVHCDTLKLKEVDNLDTVKQAIKTYHYSGSWQNSTKCVAKKAKEILSKYLPIGDKKLAIVFDIDDTLLSTFEINLLNDFGYLKGRNRAWEQKAEAPPIEPMLDLYNFLINSGFAVFLLTGREEFQRAATIKNLSKAGFKKWKGLYLKPAEYVGLPACMYKSNFRQHIVSLGYTIVASFGDQLSDMSGTAQAAHNFKLSNPMYRIP